jgi:hypothetical protein
MPPGFPGLVAGLVMAGTGQPLHLRGQGAAALADELHEPLPVLGDHRSGSDRPTQQGGVGQSWSQVESSHCGSWQPHEFGRAVR